MICNGHSFLCWHVYMNQSMENHEDAACVIGRWFRRIPRRINPQDAFTLERRVTPPWFLLHPSPQRCFVFNADDLYRHVMQTQGTNPYTGAPLLSVEMIRLARASSFTDADDDRRPDLLRPPDALDDVMNSAFELSAADFSINVDHILRLIGETPVLEEDFFTHLSTLFLVSQSSLINFPPSRVSRLFETHLFQLNRIQNAPWVNQSYLHILYNSIVSIARGIPVNLNYLAIHPRRPPHAPSRQTLIPSHILRTFRPTPLIQRSFQPRSVEDVDQEDSPSLNEDLSNSSRRFNEDSTSRNPSRNEDPSSRNEDPSSRNEDPSSHNEDPSSHNEDPSSHNEDPSSPNEDPSSPNEDLSSHNEDPDESSPSPSFNEEIHEPPSFNEDHPDEPPTRNSIPISNDEPPSDEASSSGENSHVDEHSTGTNEGLPNADEMGPRDDEDDENSTTSRVASGIHFYTLRELRELQASNTDEILRLRNLRDLRSVLIRRRARRLVQTMNDALPR